MTKRKTEQLTETIGHSFEAVLEVPPNTTEIVKTRVTSELIVHDDYDDKDAEIEEDITEIQDKALELYDYMVDEIEDADPSKRSRLAEVAGQLLNTALSATEKRKALKEHKDKLKQKDKVIAGKGNGKTTNNVFVGSHEDLMKILSKGDEEESPERIDPNDPSVIDADSDT